MYSVFGMELPSPLDKAEEERLLQDFHENRQIFLERNLRLVLHIAKKYDVNQSDLKELFSVGEMGLIKAVNTFNPGKEIKFATYASRCIENEIGKFLRHEKKHQLPSIDKPLVIDESGKELTYSDVIEDERSSNFQENLLNQELSSTILEIALNKLSYKEQVIFLAMLSGKTQKTLLKYWEVTLKAIFQG